MGSDKACCHVNVLGLGTIVLLPHTVAAGGGRYLPGNWVSWDDEAIRSMVDTLSKHSSDPEG